jgi:hypothetical protein
MNDLVAQLLGEATSRIWDRLDNYLKEGVGVGKGEGTYKKMQTGSVNQLPQVKQPESQSNQMGKEMGQTLQKQYSVNKKQILLFPPQPQHSTCTISTSALTVKPLS